MYIMGQMNPYASILLNDLHHYFPELLYRSERFHNVQDVLQYIVGVAQESPFERERRRYRGSSPTVSSSSIQGQGQGQRQEQEQEQRYYDDEKEIAHPYEFNASSSAYVVHPSSSSPSSPPSSSYSSSSSTPTRESSSATSLLQALLPIFQRRPYTSSSRFRLSVPLSMSSLSSEYSAPVPSSLQGLSQLQELFQLQERFQPVVIRPTEQQLAENTCIYRSEIHLNDNCSICQDPMEAGQEIRTIFACGHCFHRDCIDKWFEGHVQCPTCRHDVREAE